MTQNKRSSQTIGYNRVCNLEDFEALRADLEALFPSWPLHRKTWEMVQTWRALRDFGALRPDAELLGIGAGQEPTLFLLTNEVARVHATDLYGAAGMWSGVAPLAMLTDPERCAPKGITWRPDRLIVQHMDARRLRYPDATFDGVFSSSSIEHIGSLEDVKHAMREIGRVLNPGGIAALTTEVAIGDGLAGGWPGVQIYSPADLEALVTAAGLERVDTPSFAISDATLATRMTLTNAIAAPDRTPHIGLTEHGYIFTSVSLALRKPR